MSRALYKSWFVDFDPVPAKMNRWWQRGESLPGLFTELYDLFPDSLVPSELDKIPDGSEVKRLGNCYHLTMGQSLPGNTYNEIVEGWSYIDRETNTATVYRWVRDLSEKADEALRPMKVDTGGVWVSDDVCRQGWG